MRMFGEEVISQGFDEHAWQTLNMCSLKALEKFMSATEDEALKRHINGQLRSIRRQALKADSTEAQAAAIERYRYRIHSRHEISIRQSQLFLLVSSNGNQILDNWKTLLLAAAYHYEAIWGASERIQRALTSWRLLAGEQDKQDIKELLNKLPNPMGRLAEVVFHLNRLIKSDLTDRQERRLLPIRRLLEDLRDGEIRRKRELSSPVDKKDRNKPSSTKHGTNDSRIPYYSSRVAGDDDIAGFTEFIARAGAAAEHQNSVEFAEDHQASRTFICAEVAAETPDWIAQSSALTAIQARNTIHQIERREKQLVTSWSGLTNHEVSTLVRALRTEDKETEIIRLVLSIMLLTGRSFDQLARGLRDGQLQHLPNLDAWQWRYSPKLPEHKLSEKFQVLLDVQQNPVCLSLANLSCSPLAETVLDDVLKTDIEHWILMLNTSAKIRLTINRVSDYLGYYLRHLGCDDVSISLITGDTSLQQAGLYYYQFDANELHRIHSSFVSKVYGVDIKPEPQGLGGSQLLVESKVVSALLDHLTKLVGQARVARDLIEFHNRYTLFVLTVLNLATGHRPVKDPYDDLDSFDLLGRKLFISDKEVRNGDAYRTVVLPQRVVEQLAAYLQHLQALKEDLYFSDREVAQSIHSTQDGNAPLFFFLEDQGFITRVSVQPKSLHQHFSQYFDLPFNWHRHYLRTHLSRWGVVGEVIDAFMGHAKPGQEALAQFSGLSIQSFKRVADLLDEKLAELGVGVLPGWKQDA